MYPQWGLRHNIQLCLQLMRDTLYSIQQTNMCHSRNWERSCTSVPLNYTGREKERDLHKETLYCFPAWGCGKDSLVQRLHGPLTVTWVKGMDSGCGHDTDFVVAVAGWLSIVKSLSQRPRWRQHM